jgi:hypothetical protein
VTVLVVLEAVAIGLLGLLVAGLLRSHAEILRALHELGAGLGEPTGHEEEEDGTARTPRPDEAASLPTPVADVRGTTPGGDPVAVAIGGRDDVTLLAFLSSNCLTCRSFWTAFRDADLDVPGDARLVVVTKGPEGESPSTIRNLAPPGVQTVLSSEAWEDYRVPGSPYFVLVDGARAGVIGEGTGGNWPQVRDLLSQALADAALVASQRRGTGGRRARSTDRIDRVNRDLDTAGIRPGHPSLWPGLAAAPEPSGTADPTSSAPPEPPVLPTASP